MLVILGTLHSQLKKKSNYVAFYHVCEGSTLDEWRTTYINTHENIADLMTSEFSLWNQENKFFKTSLHFLTKSIEFGEEANQHTAVATVKVLPGM